MKKPKPTVPASMPREEAQQLVNLFNADRYADVELRARLLVDRLPDGGCSAGAATSGVTIDA